jgi:hypothetical protein
MQNNPALVIYLLSRIAAPVTAGNGSDGKVAEGKRSDMWSDGVCN